jgi:hypothetical protein
LQSHFPFSFFNDPFRRYLLILHYQKNVRVKDNGQSIHFIVAADVDQQYTTVIENPENDTV